MNKQELLHTILTNPDRPKNPRVGLEVLGQTDRCQCSVCLELFNSTFSFDKHRVGSYQQDERKCLTITEMENIGMVINKIGWWISSSNQFSASCNDKIEDFEVTNDLNS